MTERLTGQPDGQDPNQAPGQPPTPDEIAQSRFAGVVEKAGQFVDWVKPVAADTVQREAGIDLYGPGRQPELTTGQQFGSEVARFALHRGAERLAASRAAKS